MDKPESRNWTDQEIIAKILEDKENSYFELLYKRYVDKVRGKCWSLVRNTEVAEDLVQDIFMKAMENLHKFRQNSTFATWLYAIAYNHAIEYLRRNKRIRFEHWEDNIDYPEDVQESEITEILALREERIALLLEILKPEDKAILLMKYKEGMRMKTIMEILHIDGESAAKMKINRAKKRLVGLYREFFGPEA